MAAAQLLETEISGVYALSGLPASKDDEQMISNLKHICRGDVGRAVSQAQPVSAREVARAVMADRARSQELLVDDMDAVVQWALARGGGGGEEDPATTASSGPDAIRDRLVRRKALLDAALPADMAAQTAAALAHMERERLRRRYANDETMLGDAVSDIPRARFLASEDNYAWDMAELAQALEAKSGVMRNPLSGDLFSETDVRRILSHPLGARLRPLRLAQSQLRKGVRDETVGHVRRLGDVMLADQSEDAGLSRRGVDLFLAYVAALPDDEQRTIDSLKIPAVDKLNGRPYDYSVGQSVRDAKANTTCFHKVRGAANLIVMIVNSVQDDAVLKYRYV